MANRSLYDLSSLSNLDWLENSEGIQYATLTYRPEEQRVQLPPGLDPPPLPGSIIEPGYQFTHKIYNYLVGASYTQCPLYQWDAANRQLLVCKDACSLKELSSIKKSANNYGFRRIDKRTSRFVLLEHPELDQVEDLLRIKRCK